MLLSKDIHVFPLSLLLLIATGIDLVFLDMPNLPFFASTAMIPPLRDSNLLVRRSIAFFVDCKGPCLFKRSHVYLERHSLMIYSPIPVAEAAPEALSA